MEAFVWGGEIVNTIENPTYSLLQKVNNSLCLNKKEKTNKGFTKNFISINKL